MNLLFPRLMQRGGILPFTADFTALANGALPSDFIAPTWAIASGRAVNTPTFGAELLTDPGLEANYTAGKCDTLSKTGSPTLVEENVEIHGGAKAQKFTAVAASNNVAFAAQAGVAHKRYQFTAWFKKTASLQATGPQLSMSQTGAMPANNLPSSVLDLTYVQHRISWVSPGTASILPILVVESHGSNFNTVVVDDASLKAMTDGDAYALLPASQLDVIAKIKPPATFAGFVDATFFGIILRADAQTNPTTYIQASIKRRPLSTSAAHVSLFKRVGGTYTSLIAETVVAIVSGAYLELRASGNTISLWYNGTQVGTNQTVADVTGTIHGMFSDGSNQISEFSLVAN